jgi:hypothetical protein
MDDGPFKAVLIDQIEMSDSSQVFDLSNQGKLILENRNDTLSPILSLVEKGNTKWTIDTDVRNTTGYENCRIWEINNITITENIDQIKLNFIGYWTYGAERGSMEINRKNGENIFCLSW